jgi:anti-repressor protein
VIPFEYEGNSIRVLQIEGSPWWVAKDVCGVLGLSNVGEAVSALDGDEKSKISNSDLGRPGGHDSPIVNEPGLYSLILRSRKLEAKAFKRWITHQVLPQIRKTGGYGHAIPATYAEALRLAADQAEKIAELEPKAAAFQQIAETEGTFSLSDTAKKLGFGPNKFAARLRGDRILFYRDSGGHQVNIPFQPYIDRGYFVVRTINLDPLRQQTRVTGKGELWLAHRYRPGVVLDFASGLEVQK